MEMNNELISELREAAMEPFDPVTRYIIEGMKDEDLNGVVSFMQHQNEVMKQITEDAQKHFNEGIDKLLMMILTYPDSNTNWMDEYMLPEKEE